MHCVFGLGVRTQYLFVFAPCTCADPKWRALCMSCALLCRVPVCARMHAPRGEFSVTLVPRQVRICAVTNKKASASTDELDKCNTLESVY